MAPLLQIVDLKTRIPLRSGVVHAVDGLSFDVEQGETVGIVGESGCGKTMAAMSIMRLLPRNAYISGGEINFGGRDLTKLSDAELRKVRGNDIGMVFQDPMTSLNPTMTSGKQIAEVVLIHRDVSKAEAMERAREVLELVGLPRPAERLKDYPHQLSGGLRQRVMIAMALACDPQLLIADEPTTALDVTIQAQILRLLDRLKAELGMGIILITHDMGVIAGRADRVVVMYAGQKIETADTIELFTHVRHPYTEALLASIPKLDQDRSQILYSIPGLPPDLRRPPIACRFAARCAFATEECRTREPKLEADRDRPGHEFACFHPRASSAAEISDIAAGLLAEAESNKALAETFGKELELLEVTDEEAAALVESGGSGPPDIVLEFKGVSKEFEVTAGAVLRRKIGSLHAVTDVELAIRRGETFGIVGESGCGKTTLGRLGVALEAPTSGQVLFNGEDLGSFKRSELREKRRDLQFMFQDPYASLDPRMRVKEIISEPLDIAKRGSSSERVETVRRLLDDVGLAADHMDRYPHEFSGGQRQRLGLARALALNPDVIVADEPVSALDVSIRSQVLNLMRRVQVSYGLTYIVISHDLSVVRYVADRIGVMYLGKLVEVGTGDDIYERAAHPYTAGLLKAIPLPNPEQARTDGDVPIKGELPSPLNPPSGCRFRTRCPHVQDKCAEEIPLLRSFGGEHLAACHFPLQTPIESGSVSDESGAGETSTPMTETAAAVLADPGSGGASAPDTNGSSRDDETTEQPD
ncbi:MAG TPA: ABC transporter ATP-binding protein [Solirubrobacteraceae bacterium]|nr:ABC transporter ATP-binding protein [Solirubrobacteraceae bacterium]